MGKRLQSLGDEDARRALAFRVAGSGPLKPRCFANRCTRCLQLTSGSAQNSQYFAAARMEGAKFSFCRVCVCLKLSFRHCLDLRKQFRFSASADGAGAIPIR